MGLRRALKIGAKLIIKLLSPKNGSDKSQENQLLSGIGGLLFDNLLALLLCLSEEVSDQLEKGSRELNLSANDGLGLLDNAGTLGFLVLIVVSLEYIVLSLRSYIPWHVGDALYLFLDCGSLGLHYGETRLQRGKTIVTE